MKKEVRTGSMKVGVKTEDGMISTEEYGFRVEEEPGKLLNFDLMNHEDYGYILLFANTVCMFSYWTDEQLEQAKRVVSEGVEAELRRRRGHESSDTSE